MKQEPEEIRQADIVLACLRALGSITSREMRECNIKKPANVIIKLKRRGYRIQTIKEHGASNRQIARYILIEKDPPRLQVERRDSRFWKRR